MLRYLVEFNLQLNYFQHHNVNFLYFSFNFFRHKLSWVDRDIIRNYHAHTSTVVVCTKVFQQCAQEWKFKQRVWEAILIYSNYCMINWKHLIFYSILFWTTLYYSLVNQETKKLSFWSLRLTILSQGCSSWCVMIAHILIILKMKY